MISVNFDKDDFIRSIEVSGHANYDEHGSDIVCAAVSSMVIYAFNLCELFDSQVVGKTIDDITLINVHEYNVDIDLILDTLITSLLDLESQYPDNISVCRR